MPLLLNDLASSSGLKMSKYLLGLDIGSSSVKSSLLDIGSGKVSASSFSPSSEMNISSPYPGFAEQDPEVWLHEMYNALGLLRKQVDFKPDEIAGIGISYQMHGLVCVDKDMKPLRPSIIWCDSRAVETGKNALEALGEEFCLEHYLNAPGNFTASKLKWVKDNEPELYEGIYKVMLPGDYIAARLTGEITTTVSGLSEGIFWDYTTGSLATDLLQFYGIDPSLLARVVPSFGQQSRVTEEAGRLLGIKAGTPVCYRAGDQPNNAFSLNVLNPGEVAATAGTSGVVYGVTDKLNYDPLSRVNGFVHVNHTEEARRLGILLCVNGTGILNSWMRKNFFPGLSYTEMNELAATIPPGADGVSIFPFGNGAERILVNKDPGARLSGLSFNRHGAAHVVRAAQEGIVFALQYGMEIMQSMGMELRTIRAGHANMFLSDVFAGAFTNVSGCTLELYNTDGSVGAARGAGVGAGIYASFEESFRGMQKVKEYHPDAVLRQAYGEAYAKWKLQLEEMTGQ